MSWHLTLHDVPRPQRLMDDAMAIVNGNGWMDPDSPFIVMSYTTTADTVTITSSRLDALGVLIQTFTALPDKYAFGWLDMREHPITDDDRAAYAALANRDH